MGVWGAGGNIFQERVSITDANINPISNPRPHPSHHRHMEQKFIYQRKQTPNVKNKNCYRYQIYENPIQQYTQYKKADTLRSKGYCNFLHYGRDKREWYMSSYSSNLSCWPTVTRWRDISTIPCYFICGAFVKPCQVTHLTSVTFTCLISGHRYQPKRGRNACFPFMLTYTSYLSGGESSSQ